MAKGKGGKSSGAVSAGERRSSMKTSGIGVTGLEKMLYKQQAWIKGQNPKVTIENPNKSETNKPFIRVALNEVKGRYQDIKKRSFFIS